MHTLWLFVLLSTSPRAIAPDGDACSVTVVGAAARDTILSAERDASDRTDPHDDELARIFSGRGWRLEAGPVREGDSTLSLKLAPRGRTERRCRGTLLFRWPGIDSNGDAMVSARIWNANGWGPKAGQGCDRARQKLLRKLRTDLWACP